MEFLDIGTAGAAGATTAVQMDKSPFMEGSNGAGVLYEFAAFHGTADVETSDDGTTWSQLTTFAAGAPFDGCILRDAGNISRYMRVNVTSWTAGSVTARLVS